LRAFDESRLWRLMKVWRQAFSVQREPTRPNAQPPHHGGAAAVIAAAQRRGHQSVSEVIRHPDKLGVKRQALGAAQADTGPGCVFCGN